VGNNEKKLKKVLTILKNFHKILKQFFNKLLIIFGGTYAKIKKK